jgi:hypothetical protein
VEGYREELTTEELQELEKEEHKTKMDTLSSGSEEEETEEAPTSLIKEIVAKWMDVKNFAQNYHPNKAQTSRNSTVWNDQTMSHFRNILRRQQKQSSLDRFLVNVKPGDPQAGPSREKRKFKFVKFSFISSVAFVFMYFSIKQCLNYFIQPH